MQSEIPDIIVDMQPTAEERINFNDLGLIGTVEAAEMVGWPPAKFAMYHSRGKVPEPVGFVGGRPAWTKRQIECFIGVC